MNHQYSHAYRAKGTKFHDECSVVPFLSPVENLSRLGFHNLQDVLTAAPSFSYCWSGLPSNNEKNPCTCLKSNP